MGQSGKPLVKRMALSLAVAGAGFTSAVWRDHHGRPPLIVFAFFLVTWLVAFGVVMPAREGWRRIRR